MKQFAFGADWQARGGPWLAGLLLLATTALADEVVDQEREENRARTEVSDSPFGIGKESAADHEKIDDQVIKPREEPGADEDGFAQFVPEIERTETQAEPVRPPPFYQEWLKDGADEQEDFVLDLVAVSIQEMVQIFAEKLSFNYLVDPKVASGAVTMRLTQTKMSRREIWQLFEQILWLNGAYGTVEGRMLRIMPFVRMPQERRIFATDQPANVEVKIVKVRNVPAKSLIDKILPFLTEGARATEMAGENAILLVESPENMPKLDALLAVLDRKQRATWPKTAISCVNVSAVRIKEELAAILPVLGFAVAVDDVVAEPGSIHLTSVDRMEVLVASAANQEALDELKKWAAILDRSDVGEQERVFVYKVINGTAEELLSALATLFNIEGTTLASDSAASGTGGGGGGDEDGGFGNEGNSGRSSGGGMRGTSAPRTTVSTSSVKSSNSGSGSASGKATPASIFEVPAKIFADGKHNRMVIRTTPRTYAMIKAVLETLDTVPTQVLLQVLIAEIRLTESNEFGLEYYTKVRSGDSYRSLMGYDGNMGAPGLVEGVGAGGGSVFTPEALSTSEDGGFKYLLYNKGDDSKYAYLRAAAGTGNFKILSSPQIAAVSGTEAALDVGEEIPIITRTIADGTAGSGVAAVATSNEVQYKKTGILLKITPQVTKGGLITMNLNQEVSQRGEDVAAGGSTYPSFINRQVTTSLSIRDGGTIIVGGIIQERERQSQRSLPFIAKIPLLASLFGLNEFETDRTELLIMITGTVISEATNLEKMVGRYRQAVAALKEFEEKNVEAD